MPFAADIPDAAQRLHWDQATRVIGFRNTYRQYAGDVFHAGGATPLPLPNARAALPRVRYRFAARQSQLRDYLQHQSATGLLVLKNGRVAQEYYGAGIPSGRCGLQDRSQSRWYRYSSAWPCTRA